MNKKLDNELNLDELAVKAKRDYDKAWRKAHPEKVKEYNHRYWVKKVKAALEASQSSEEESE